MSFVLQYLNWPLDKVGTDAHSQFVCCAAFLWWRRRHKHRGEESGLGANLCSPLAAPSRRGLLHRAHLSILCSSPRPQLHPAAAATPQSCPQRAQRLRPRQH